MKKQKSTKHLLIFLLLLNILFTKVIAQTITSGTAYRWSPNSTATSDNNRTAFPELTDADVSQSYFLRNGLTTEPNTLSTTFEAAGLVFPALTSFDRFTFVHGEYINADAGAWSANVVIQTTVDGTTWVTATDWFIAPAYLYTGGTTDNRGAVSGVTFVARYIGASAIVQYKGIRVSGQVHTNGSQPGSRYSSLKEVSAALSGVKAYRWGSNSTASGNANRVAIPALTDGNVSQSYYLRNGLTTVPTSAPVTTFEAGGLVFDNLNHFDRFTFVHGEYISVYEGAWSSSVTIQATYDGTTWFNTTDWSIAPAYLYTNNATDNRTAVSGVTFVANYTGNNYELYKGIRVCGQVHNNGSQVGSRYSSLKEVSVETIVQTGGIDGSPYRWFQQASATGNSVKVGAPTLSDGDLINTTFLNSGTGISALAPSGTQTNGYEAAGLIFPQAQKVNRFTFINGPYSNGASTGTFTANLTIQGTTDGATWTNLTGWAITPGYIYSTVAVSNTRYTAVYTGATDPTLKGIRVCGQVNTPPYGNTSYAACLTEVIAAYDIIGGTAYRWYNNTTNTSNSNRVASPKLNDGDNGSNTYLYTGTSNYGTGAATSSYEAAGVIFPTAQPVNNFWFTNGSYSGGGANGAWAGIPTIQGTTDGTTWNDLPGWSITPSYTLLSSTVSNTRFEATLNSNGTPNSLLGIRVNGIVNNCGGTGTCSKGASIKELFAAYTSVLPIKLESFTVNSTSNCTANITWVTSLEFEVKHFEIQQSTDGINFNTVKIENAKNMASTYTVNELLTAGKVNYFRLRIVDIDGKVSYSIIKTASCNESKISAIHTLGNNYVQLLNVPDGNYAIEIFNAVGQRVAIQNANIVNTAKIYLPNVANGIFTLIIYNKQTGTKTIKSIIISNSN